MAKYIEREAVEKFIEDGLNNPNESKRFGHDGVLRVCPSPIFPSARNAYNGCVRPNSTPPRVLDAGGGVMKYKLTMEFETEKPYKEWDVSPYTNEALAIALIKALGIKEAIINNIALQGAE